jgi:hypothetical protein
MGPRVPVLVCLVLRLTSAAASELRDKLHAQMSIFNVRLEETTFSAVKTLLGHAEVRHNGGDAAASASFLCYVGADGTTLVLGSNAEMAGGGRSAEEGSMHVAEYHLLSRAALADFSWVLRGCGGASGCPSWESFAG